jgi:predicted Fe-S protein YdhL (DUF1289 family)
VPPTSKNGGNIVIATNGWQKCQSNMSYNTFACLNVCYGGLPQEMICKGCMETSKEKAIRKGREYAWTRMTRGRQGRHVNNLFTRSGEITTIKRSDVCLQGFGHTYCSIRLWVLLIRFLLSKSKLLSAMTQQRHALHLLLLMPMRMEDEYSDIIAGQSK